MMIRIQVAYRVMSLSVDFPPSMVKYGLNYVSHDSLAPKGGEDTNIGVVILVKGLDRVKKSGMLTEAFKAQTAIFKLSESGKHS